MKGKEYEIPFGYQKYGRIPVEADSLEEAFAKAEARLEGMTLEEMEGCAEFLPCSEEIDREGVAYIDGRVAGDGDQ